MIARHAAAPQPEPRPLRRAGGSVRDGAGAAAKAMDKLSQTMDGKGVSHAAGKKRPRGGDNSYWTSYSDMMAGMLFVFALILFAAVYQLVDLQQKKTIELQTKEAQLSTQQSLLIDQEAELKDKEELLAATTLALQQQQEELDQNRTALTSAQDNLALQQSKIEGAGGAAGRPAGAD